MVERRVTQRCTGASSHHCGIGQVEDPAVDHPAVHVLAAGERAALDEQGAQPGAGGDDRRGRPGRAAADDDDVEVDGSAMVLADGCVEQLVERRVGVGR